MLNYKLFTCSWEMHVKWNTTWKSKWVYMLLTLLISVFNSVMLSLILTLYDRLVLAFLITLLSLLMIFDFSQDLFHSVTCFCFINCCQGSHSSVDSFLYWQLISLNCLYCDFFILWLCLISENMIEDSADFSIFSNPDCNSICCPCHGNFF